MASTTIHFLSADTALSKSFWLDSQGELQKSSYPNVKDFTSHTVHCDNLRDFYAALVKHSNLGHCLLKGQLRKDLSSESRAGSTKSDDATSWVCLDLDGAPYASPKAFMDSIPEFKDVAHIVQYSASHGIADKKGLSCHIFMMMDGKLPAPSIKTWMLDKNLTDATLKSGITLSRTAATLHYPLDVTANQNDKLLYIAPPKLGRGVRCNLKDSERIQYVTGKHPQLSHRKMQSLRALEAVKKEERELRDDLRKAAKLPALRSQTKWVGEYEVQAKPGEAVISGQKEERGFVYFNLNGGDSWSYYHPVGKPDLIHCFKDDVSYNTKELLPGYYKDVKAQQRIAQSQPGNSGDMVLAFRDKRTAVYWNGTWNEANQHLELYPAKSELQLNHWMQNHDLPPYDVIPVWDLHFTPTSSVIVDEEAHTINTYVPSPWFRGVDPTIKGSSTNWPTIKRIMMHAISGGKDDETFEQWLNWLAVIFQYRVKPQTAWMLHGVEGTGKGIIVNKILAVLLGRNYVQSKRASELEDKFNGWLEQALIGFIDEIKVSASARKDIISGDLRNFITEDYVTIRGMQRAAVQVKNYTGLIFSSNEPDPVQIKEMDRRYNVGHFQTEKLKITQHEIDVVIPNELAAFMQYICTREADISKAATAIKNEAHAKLVENNKTSIEVTTSQIANGDLMGLWELRMDLNLALQLTGGSAGYAHLYHDLIKREIRLLIDEAQANYKVRVLLKNKADAVVTVESKLSRDELIVIFEHCVGNIPKTANKFTSMLKHRGITTERIRTNGVLTYGLKVEWKAPASWLEEMRKEFEPVKPKLTRAK